MRALDSLVTLVTERVAVAKDPARPYVGLEHIPSGGASLKQVGSSADSISTNGVFASGDILFGKLRPRLRKSVRATQAGYCSTDILVLRTLPGVDPCFARFVTQSDEIFRRAIQTEEGTKMPRCSWRDLRTTVVFAPESVGEQQRIAAILTSLDTAIEATEALIEKHQQIKSGLMLDLFTRGALADGRLRPAPAEARGIYQATKLGLLPNDWHVEKLGDLVNPARPIVYGILMPGYGFPGGVPVVKVKDIRDRRIAFEDLLLTSPQIDNEYRRSRLKPGDVLFTIRGTVGRIAVVPNELEDANITQDTARMDLTGVSGEFTSYYFETPMAKRFFDVNTLGVAVQGINLGELRKLPIPVPPPPEQERIVAMVAAAYRRIDSENAVLEKLRMQKQGLMQDLLTGKVRVPAPAREAAI